MKKNWLLVPVTLCLVLVPASVVFAVMRLHEQAAAAAIFACCAFLYCAFPPVYEKCRTATSLRIPWKIVFWIYVLGLSPAFLLLTLVPLIDITLNAQRMGNISAPGPFGTMNFDRVVILSLLAVMAAGIAVAFFTIWKHRRRGEGPDAPFVALVSFYIAYGVSVMLHPVFAACHFRVSAEGLDLSIVFAVVGFMAFQLFSLAYIVLNRRCFNAFPVLALFANLLAFGACCALVLAGFPFEAVAVAAVAVLPLFLLIRESNGIPAWLRAFAMASLAGLAAHSFTELRVEHPEHVYSLAGAALAGWALFGFAGAIRQKRNAVLSVLKGAAWVIAAALLAANELYYGSFTDRSGAAYSILLHLALAAAGYTAALAIHSSLEIRAGLGAFMRRPAVIAPVAATLAFAIAAAALIDDAVELTTGSLAGIRLGSDASALRTSGTHAQGGLVVRSMIYGRSGTERNTMPEIDVNVSDGCASTVLGKRASYVEAVNITLDRTSPRRVFFKGKRITPVLETPGDIVALCEVIGAELRTESALSNPIEEGGPLYFAFAREKGYPSFLRLEYDTCRPVPGAARSRKLRALHLILGVNRQCGTLAAPGTPNRMFTRDMVKNLAWLGSDARYSVKKEISNVRAAPDPDSRTVSTVARGMMLPVRWKYSGDGGTWLMFESGWVAEDALVQESALFERASYGDALVPTEDDYAALSEMVKRACDEHRRLTLPRDSPWHRNADRRITFTARLIPESDSFRLEADGRAFLGGSYTRGEITELGDETLNAALRGDTKAPAVTEGEGVPGIPVRVFGRLQVEDGCPQAGGAGMFHGGDPDARGHVRFALERLEKI